MSGRLSKRQNGLEETTYAQLFASGYFGGRLLASGEPKTVPPKGLFAPTLLGSFRPFP